MALHGKKKYVDKPCLGFTTTSALPTHCALTSEPVSGSLSLHPLFYRFLQSWPHIAHLFVCTFVNAGRYTRANCLYPLVGHCEGVCRDFAVLGYCEASIECSEQHVYECPDLLRVVSARTSSANFPMSAHAGAFLYRTTTSSCSGYCVLALTLTLGVDRWLDG